ncbi:hypothetical protein E2C01_033330 [Portunus trituberculatus]|uniref:Uncharacterized protein n=1 Tax=Portunus trituberculatus TaxID=210409 RepID=A0A5B7EYF1_PORTR|nr:hypothetical protein [Portunus trituberculatus]
MGGLAWRVDRSRYALLPSPFPVALSVTGRRDWGRRCVPLSDPETPLLRHQLRTRLTLTVPSVETSCSAFSKRFISRYSKGCKTF